MNVLNYIDKKIIWIFGPAAAGKTTFIAFLNNQLKKRNIKPLNLSDLKELISVIKKDKEKMFHQNIAKNQFRITKPFVYDLVFLNLLKKISENRKKNKPILIEVSCGLDLKKKFNLSIKSRLNLIPKDVIKQSKFIYINTPLIRRQQFNQKRGGFSKTPKEIFNRFFQKDDFNEINQKKFHFLVINNHGKIGLLNKFAQQIFLK
ncbi:MAG: hypothetical protein QHH09_02780 [Microgenomates group bacterium]|nr:hypothetical protein [Microgenomates group bacterium]